MSLAFFREHGGCRIRSYDPQPYLLDDRRMGMEEVIEIDGLSFEVEADKWQKIDISQKTVSKSWPLLPRRFIDGVHDGRVVTCLYSKERFPVPVQLAEIGAVEMRDFNGTLRRTNERVERVVVLMAHLFPWDEIESLASVLQQHSYRLLIAEQPKPLKEGSTAGYTYDYERMRKTTHNRSVDEMLRLEKQLLASARNIPTVVDGRLEPRASAFSQSTVPIVGLIKTHSQNYLHPRGWQVFYDLHPKQRTPAFRIENTTPQVISWYLRLDGTQNDLPNYGIVRIEVAVDFFHEQCSVEDRNYIDSLSKLLFDYRCRDESYGRAPVSIQPIQRAEESLRSLFTNAQARVGHFYYLTKL